MGWVKIIEMGSGDTNEFLLIMKFRTPMNFSSEQT